MFKELLEFFTKQFIKRAGRKPQTPAEVMSIQNDVVRYLNETKGKGVTGSVRTSTGDVKPIPDPFQGFTPKVIQGGKSKEGIGTLFKDSPEAIAKIKADNKAAIERLKEKTKKDDFASGGLARVGMFMGGFTKAEVLIQILKNTIKGSKDSYVKKNFPNWIKEIQKNPKLALDENVWKELTGGLPKNQKLVVHSDDSVDFFTQSKFGPHNIEKTLEFQKKHNLSRDQANKILRMDPEDRVLEMKRLETIADRNKITKTLGSGEDLSSVSPAYGEKYVDQLLTDWKPGKGKKGHASGGIAGQLHMNRTGYKKGSTRDRLQKDWKSYATLKDLLYSAPPFLQDKPDAYTKGRDAERTRLKELFMYGEPTIDANRSILEALRDDPTIRKFKEWRAKRKEKASGGRVPMIFGGSAGLKGLIASIKAGLNKGRPEKIKTLFPKYSADEKKLLKLGEKYLPKDSATLAAKEIEAKAEGIEVLINRLKHDKKLLEEQAKNKAKKDPSLDFLMESLEKTMPEAYGPHLKKYTNIDKDILQLETVKKNITMKDRKLHASGGIAGQLHMNRPGYGSGLKVLPKVEITQTESTPAEGIDVGVRDTSYGGSGLYQGDKAYVGGDYMTGNVKVDVQKEGETLFKDTMSKDDMKKLYIGLGQKEGNRVEVGTDTQGNYTFNIVKSFNQGGRAGSGLNYLLGEDDQNVRMSYGGRVPLAGGGGFWKLVQKAFEKLKKIKKPENYIMDQGYKLGKYYKKHPEQGADAAAAVGAGTLIARHHDRQKETSGGLPGLLGE